MPYISSDGQISESRSIWRLSFITETIWGIINFVILFFQSMINPNKNSRGAGYTSDYRRPGGGGSGSGAPTRRMGGFRRNNSPNAPPMGGGG